MSSYSKTFTVAAIGLAIRLRPGQSLTYSAVVDALETFTGNLQLQRSRNGGQSWEAVVTLDGTSVAVAAGTTSGTIVNESQSAEMYRWQNFTDTGADEVDVTLVDVLDVDPAPYWNGGLLFTSKGVEALRVNDDGSVTIVAASLTSLSNIATLFTAYLATLPTADPHVAGAPYLLLGVLTVSAG